MDDITLRDLLIILTNQINEVKDNQKELSDNQKQLVDSTNHKIDYIRKQGIAAIVVILLVGAPVVVDHWNLLYERVQALF